MAKDKEKILAAAQKLVQKGQLDKAIKEYQKALEEDRKDVRIHLKLGDLFAKLKNKDAAIKAYSDAAKYYTKDGFYSKAVAVYKQALGIDDTRVDLYLSLADLYHKLGLVNDAMTQYHTVAASYEREGQIKEALDTLKRMVDMDPRNVILVTKLAELYYKNGLKAEGYQAFRQALEQLKEENRFEEYTRMLEKLAKSDPENLQNLKELGAIYIRRQVWDRAYQVLGRIYKTDPEDLDNLNNLAQVAIRLEQKGQAAELFKALASKYKGKGLNQKATDALRKVLQLNPQDPDARRVLGAGAVVEAEPEEVPEEPELLEEEVEDGLEALGEEGEEEVTIEAGEALGEEEEVHLSPDQILEHLTEADVYLKYGLRDKALHHINAVLKSDPANLKAHLRLKDIHVEAGDTAKTLELLHKIVQLGQQQKDLATARQALAQVLELNPNDAKAKELQATLAKAVAGPAPAKAAPAPKVEEEALEEEAVLAVDLELEEPVVKKPVEKPKPPPAPAKPAPAPAAAAGDFNEELEEAEFYLQQGLEDEARKVFLGILKRDPGHTVSLRKLQELEEPKVEAQVEEEVVQEGPTPAFAEEVEIEAEEVAEEIEEEVAEEVEPPAAAAPAAKAAEAKAPAPAPGKAPPPPALEVEEEVVVEEEAPLEIELEVTPEAKAAPPPPAKAVAPEAETEISLEVPEPAPPPPSPDEETTFIPPVLAEGEDSLFGPPQPGEELFDLAAELESEDLGEVSSEISSLGTSAQFGFEDMFRAFKKGVAQAVSPEESSAHYDLGLAYKEMGLIDDAIAEFQTAMAGSFTPSNCLLMIGLCRADRSETPEAIASLQQALALEGLSEQEAGGIYFEMGKIFQQCDDLPHARWAYEQAEQADPTMMGLAERLAELAEVSAEAPAAVAPEATAAEIAAPPAPPVAPGPVREDVRRETAALDEVPAQEPEQPKPMQQKKSKKISYL